MNTKKVEMWVNTLQKKTDSLRNALGVTAIIGILSLIAVLAFSHYEVRDVIILVLLLYSLIGCVPYVEVAKVKTNNAFFSKQLTLMNWKNEIKNGSYDVLSSNLHFMQPFFPLMSALSFLLFLVHKIGGNEYVHYNTVLSILIIQVPFNHALGLNPLGAYLTRQSTSNHITQGNLKRYLSENITK